MNWNGPIVHTGGGSAFITFASALFPPELSPSFIYVCITATVTTMVFASAAMTIAVPVGLVLGIIASGKIVENHSPLKSYIIISTRLLLGAMRSIHELVWAVLFVVAVGLSPLAAIISLAIPYAGILGRIYSELIQDVPDQPVQTLRSAGASPIKLLMYGYIPLALPDLLSYTFYRFECAIRASAILSFIGIQGIGYQIQLSLHDLLFDQVWTLLIFLVALIVLVDLWSTNLRRKLME